MNRAKLEPWQKRQMRKARKSLIRSQRAALSIQAIRDHLRTFGHAANEQSGAAILAGQQAGPYAMGRK